MSRDGVPMGAPLKATLDWMFSSHRGGPGGGAKAAIKHSAAKDPSFLTQAPWTWQEGAKSAPYMQNSDLLLDEELTGSMKVRLVKRKVAVTRKQFSKLWQPEFLDANEFSARCANPKGSADNATGKGPFNLTVYYEPQKKAAVERAFDSVGCAISKTQQEPVSPETTDEIEMYLQYRHAIGLFGRFLLVQDTELEVLRQEGGLSKV
mmetsp:Transcript_16227/g.48970  ORF Transcript_16227/g.48970 Transcript_16227/m.48970 type:complete len:206 (+) Transcript_16227:80-697(+)|eukprot:CAMPEP_0175253646 /NCGR_PEP_ID=MMETSP0093-20121207/36789_1 /TAXON_ID=311494 /ORGANISM="Alexandrium monilatum, Strain CCMP3105" /LENGTH=205 /DNA_ID=CAMNT_0016547955 /DNA_START=76 /DNA_END=693 /DNA_ORIENTATION=-